jgi:hypothetical protein
MYFMRYMCNIETKNNYKRCNMILLPNAIKQKDTKTTC